MTQIKAVAIYKRIEEEGLCIRFSSEVRFAHKMAKEFYEEHDGETFFPGLVEHMCIGPNIYMELLCKDRRGRSCGDVAQPHWSHSTRVEKAFESQ